MMANDGRFLVAAMVTDVGEGPFVYPACEECYRKLTTSRQQGCQFYRCQNCGQVYNKGKEMYRYRLCLTITDSTTMTGVTAFGGMLNSFFGVSATDYHKIIVSEVKEMFGGYHENVLQVAVHQAFINQHLLFGLRASVSNTQLAKSCVISLKDICKSSDVSSFARPSPDLIAVQVVRQTEHVPQMTVLDWLQQVKTLINNTPEICMDRAAMMLALNSWQTPPSCDVSMLSSLTRDRTQSISADDVSDVTLMSSPDQASLHFSCDDSMEETAKVGEDPCCEFHCPEVTGTCSSTSLGSPLIAQEHLIETDKCGSPPSSSEQLFEKDNHGSPLKAHEQLFETGHQEHSMKFISLKPKSQNSDKTGKDETVSPKLVSKKRQYQMVEALKKLPGDAVKLITNGYQRENECIQKQKIFSGESDSGGLNRSCGSYKFILTNRKCNKNRSGHVLDLKDKDNFGNKLNKNTNWLIKKSSSKRKSLCEDHSETSVSSRFLLENPDNSMENDHGIEKVGFNISDILNLEKLDCRFKPKKYNHSYYTPDTWQVPAPNGNTCQQDTSTPTSAASKKISFDLNDTLDPYFTGSQEISVLSNKKTITDIKSYTRTEPPKQLKLSNISTLNNHLPVRSHVLDYLLVKLDDDDDVVRGEPLLKPEDDDDVSSIEEWIEDCPESEDFDLFMLKMNNGCLATQEVYNLRKLNDSVNNEKTACLKHNNKRDWCKQAQQLSQSEFDSGCKKCVPAGTDRATSSLKVHQDIPRLKTSLSTARNPGAQVSSPIFKSAQKISLSTRNYLTRKLSHSQNIHTPGTLTTPQTNVSSLKKSLSHSIHTSGKLTSQTKVSSLKKSLSHSIHTSGKLTSQTKVSSLKKHVFNKGMSHYIQTSDNLTFCNKHTLNKLTPCSQHSPGKLASHTNVSNLKKQIFLKNKAQNIQTTNNITLQTNINSLKNQILKERTSQSNQTPNKLASQANSNSLKNVLLKSTLQNVREGKLSLKVKNLKTQTSHQKKLKKETDPVHIKKVGGQATTQKCKNSENMASSTKICNTRSRTLSQKLKKVKTLLFPKANIIMNKPYNKDVLNLEQITFHHNIDLSLKQAIAHNVHEFVKTADQKQTLTKVVNDKKQNLLIDVNNKKWTLFQDLINQKQTSCTDVKSTKKPNLAMADRKPKHNNIKNVHIFSPCSSLSANVTLRRNKRMHHSQNSENVCDLDISSGNGNNENSGTEKLCEQEINNFYDENSSKYKQTESITTSCSKTTKHATSVGVSSVNNEKNFQNGLVNFTEQCVKLWKADKMSSFLDQCITCPGLFKCERSNEIKLVNSDNNVVQPGHYYETRDRSIVQDLSTSCSVHVFPGHKKGFNGSICEISIGNYETSKEIFLEQRVIEEVATEKYIYSAEFTKQDGPRTKITDSMSYAGDGNSDITQKMQHKFNTEQITKHKNYSAEQRSHQEQITEHFDHSGKITQRENHVENITKPHDCQKYIQTPFEKDNFNRSLACSLRHESRDSEDFENLVQCRDVSLDSSNHCEKHWLAAEVLHNLNREVSQNLNRKESQNLNGEISEMSDSSHDLFSSQEESLIFVSGEASLDNQQQRGEVTDEEPPLPPPPLTPTTNPNSRSCQKERSTNRNGIKRRVSSHRKQNGKRVRFSDRRQEHLFFNFEIIGSHLPVVMKPTLGLKSSLKRSSMDFDLLGSQDLFSDSSHNLTGSASSLGMEPGRQSPQELWDSSHDLFSQTPEQEFRQNMAGLSAQRRPRTSNKTDLEDGHQTNNQTSFSDDSMFDCSNSVVYQSEFSLDLFSPSPVQITKMTGQVCTSSPRVSYQAFEVCVTPDLFS